MLPFLSEDGLMRHRIGASLPIALIKPSFR